jgi:hypothetical protein
MDNPKACKTMALECLIPELLLKRLTWGQNQLKDLEELVEIR